MPFGGKKQSGIGTLMCSYHSLSPRVRDNPTIWSCEVLPTFHHDVGFLVLIFDRSLLAVDAVTDDVLGSFWVSFGTAVDVVHDADSIFVFVGPSLGRELGMHALEEYISTKAVHFNYGEKLDWPL